MCNTCPNVYWENWKCDYKFYLFDRSGAVAYFVTWLQFRSLPARYSSRLLDYKVKLKLLNCGGFLQVKQGSNLGVGRTVWKDKYSKSLSGSVFRDKFIELWYGDGASFSTMERIQGGNRTYKQWSIYICAVISRSSGLQSSSPNTMLSVLCPRFIPLTHIKITLYDLAQLHFAGPSGNKY